MKSQYVKNLKLPDRPGVYFFQKGKDILYIGKATSLRDRVRSYFSRDLINTRGPLIIDMVTLADNLKWQETDSVLEALILEANLIKKHQPKYNTKEKDNKSFNYVCITNDSIPKVSIIRGRNLKISQNNTFGKVLACLPARQGRGGREPEPDHFQKYYFATYNSVFGPFPNGSQLKEAMKIIRRIFPYIDDDSIKKNNKEFYKQLGLIPTIGATSRKASFSQVLGRGGWEPGPDHLKKNFSAPWQEYKNNLKNIKLLFNGKKKSIIIGLKKEMMNLAKNKEFEKAGEIKKKIFALEHINDVALIKGDNIMQNHENFSVFTPKRPYADKNFHDSAKLKIFRIEAYDIAHMSGKNMVGVMTVISNGEISKNDYRKFIIKTQKNSNDAGALFEVLSRRFTHKEWPNPDLIVVDGNMVQINVAKKFVKDIPIVSVVKDNKHKAKAVLGDGDIIKKHKRGILLSNAEAHRFAITFHKKRRNKNFLIY